MQKCADSILLVDDEPRLLAGLRRRLSSSFCVFTATSGAEALEQLKLEQGIKVIVADMQMPEMTGIELLKEVKKEHPAIRRIMLTGNSDQETAVAAINEGQVMRFLRKPCNANQLSVVLEQAVKEYAFQAEHTTDIAVRNSSGPDNSREVLASMLDHELELKLANLGDMGAVIEQSSDTQMANEKKTFLMNIKNTCGDVQWLAGCMNELNDLSIARARNGDGHKFDLMTTLRSEVKSFQKEVEERSLTLSIDSLRRSAEVIGFEGEIRLVLRELIHNAIIHNIEGGHISVTVNCEKQQVGMRIYSTGGHITHEEISQGFEQLKPAENTYGYSRVCLGLKIVSAVSEINQAYCLVEPFEAGGMVSYLFLRRHMTAHSEKIVPEYQPA